MYPKEVALRLMGRLVYVPVIKVLPVKREPLLPLHLQLIYISEQYHLSLSLVTHDGTDSPVASGNRKWNFMRMSEVMRTLKRVSALFEYRSTNRIRGPERTI